jgi:O-antigen/teichoic acid export membrane protein
MTEPPLEIDSLVDPSPMETGQHRLPGASGAGRAIWALLDQGLSSATNIGILLILAHLVSPADVGRFSAAFLFYLIALNVCRSLVSEPMIISTRQPDLASQRGHAAGSALLVGAVAGIVYLPVAFLWRGLFGWTLLAMAVALPALLLQDTWRFISFASGKPKKAAVNDAIWLVLAATLLVTAKFLGSVSSLSFMSAWAFSGACAGAFGCLQFRTLPRLVSSVTWLKSKSKLSIPMVLEYALAGGSAQLGLATVGAICGLAALGEVRIALALLGPAYVLYQGVSAFALPELVRLGDNHIRYRRTVLILQLTMAGIALLLLSTLLIVPKLGALTVGDSWSSVHPLLIPLGVFVSAEGAMVGARVALRAGARVRDTLRTRAFMAPLSLALVVIGASRGGVDGAVWGMAMASSIAVGFWSWAIYRPLTTIWSRHLGR